MYVDVILNAGNWQLQDHTEANIRILESKPRVFDMLEFLEAQVCTNDDGSFIMSQQYY